MRRPSFTSLFIGVKNHLLFDIYIYIYILNVFYIIQGGSNMTGTDCDLFTHKSSRSYLNHLVLLATNFDWLIRNQANKIQEIIHYAYTHLTYTSLEFCLPGNGPIRVETCGRGYNVK